MVLVKKQSEKYKIPAVRKAFAILESFAADNQPRNLSEISRQFGLPVSTTSSLLNTLVSCGYFNRNDRGGYALTTKLMTLSHTAVDQAQLLKLARPALKELTEATGLTSVLAVQEKHQVVWIDKVEGSNDIRLAAQVGKLMHPHHTSSGKAILAFLPEAEFAKIVKISGLPRFTPKTITSLRELKAELAKVRHQGYAIDDGETDVGIRGVGAPIFDSNGKVIAAVAIGGTLFDFESKIKRMIAKVKAAADNVSENLGYKVPGRKRTISG